MQSLYAILGIDRDAKPHDIERAYRRIKAQMQRETTPPDARLRVMVEHAHDILMDPARREAYDREQHSPQAQLARVRRSPAAIASIAAACAAAAWGIWFASRAPDAPARAAKPRQVVQNAVSMAVGRVHRIDLSGKIAPLGLAFAIGEGALVTSCQGLSPDAEMFVQFGARHAPVRVSAVDDATGLCRLTGGSVGSWPLELATSALRPGEPAYVVRVGPGGDAQLADTHMKKATHVAARNAFETDTAMDAAALGGPLIDVEARVAGAASRVGGRMLYVQVPPGWIRQEPSERPATAPTPVEPAAKPDAPAPQPGPANISPERRERLEKAFRPPPNVPADL